VSSELDFGPAQLACILYRHDLACSDFSSCRSHARRREEIETSNLGKMSVVKVYGGIVHA
jgi:hypothetical protein